MSKIILFDDEARGKIKIGVDTLAKAVMGTLGPKGRNVIIEKKFSEPQVTKDGVTVAKEIELEDPIENMGAQMVKSVANKTAYIAGDGTTTATLLAQSILNEGMALIVKGSNPIDVKRGIDKATAIVVDNLKILSQPVVNNKMIRSVALVSSNNDSVIADVITEAFDKVGIDGIIATEKGDSLKTTLRLTSGFEFNRGYISKSFINNKSKMRTDFDQAYIFITDKKISTFGDIEGIAVAAMKADMPLLIICEEMESEALTTLTVNCERNILKVAVVKAPGFGEGKKDYLSDIAIYTGATVVSEDAGYSLKSFKSDFFGVAKVEIHDQKTILIAEGNEIAVNERISEVKILLEGADNDRDRAILHGRITRLTGKAAIITVGGAMDADQSEIYDRVDDALKATAAAISEGIIPGGGVAYIRSIDVLKNGINICENPSEKVGMEIILKSLEAPLKTILENGGWEPDRYIKTVKESFGNYGFNARTEIFEDLIEAGVFDPVKVARVALESAASIAGLMLTTNCAIVEKQKPEFLMPEMPGLPPQ